MKKVLGSLAAALLFASPTVATAADTETSGPINCNPISVPVSTTPSAISDLTLDHEINCGNGPIPGRLMIGGKVNIKAFTIKIKDGWREPRGQAWRIERDHAGHGGSYWKLFSPNNVKTASIRTDGMIAKLY